MPNGLPRRRDPSWARRAWPPLPRGLQEPPPSRGARVRAGAIPLRTMGSGLTLLGRGALALDRGDAAAAAAFAERFLRGVPSAHRLERVGGLELLARAQAALGDRVAAAKTQAELRSIAEAIGTPPLHAAARFIAGTIALAAGEHEAARPCFEDAIDLFDASASPYDAARARLELGRVLAAQGRADLAAREAHAASAALQQLGATRDHEQAVMFLGQLARGRDTQGTFAAASILTGRQREILRLVARGQSDKEVATLAISEHTVHRHIANILRALEAPSRAAAVAQAAKRGVL